MSDLKNAIPANLDFLIVLADIIRYLLGQSFLSKFCYCFTLEHSYRFRDAPEIRLFIPQPVVLLVELAKASSGHFPIRVYKLPSSLGLRDLELRLVLNWKC